MEGGGGMMVKEEVYSGDVGTRWRFGRYMGCVG